MKLQSFVALLVVLGIVSCKKEQHKTTTPCNTILYGYSGAEDTTTAWPHTPKDFGTTDELTIVNASVSTLNISTKINQGTYNTADNCYYTFTDSGSTSLLCRATATGGVSYHKLPNSDGYLFSSIVYNALNNKLTAVKLGSVDTLIEITYNSGGAVTYTALATFTNENFRPISTTVDPATGAVYVGMSVTSITTLAYKILKLSPGASSFSVIDSVADRHIYGLKYNSSDDMLYAITHGTYTVLSPNYFIKINPSGGSTVISSLPVIFYFDYYSTCLDACNGKYIMCTPKQSATGTGWSADSSVISQISLSGTLLQSNTVAGRYQGLDVKY